MELLVSISRNVENVSEFDTFLSRFNADGAIYAWLKSTFRKWVISNGPAVQVTSVSDDSPSWAKEAAAKGDLYKIDYEACDLAVRPVIDYLHHLQDTGGRFDRMSFDEANKQQADWHKKLAEKANSTVYKEDGIRVIKMFEDGFAWVSVTGKASLNREGDLMGHCVGSYYERVKKDIVAIYSLRDAKNEPHVTIEHRVSKNAIEQIKGKANEEVIAKYRKYILAFLADGNFARIETDESGLTAQQIRKVIKNKTKASTRTVSIHDVKYILTKAATPIIHETYNTEDLGDSLKSLDGNTILSDGVFQDRKNKYKPALLNRVLDLVFYCQQKELCGFSLYRLPKLAWSWGFAEWWLEDTAKPYLQKVAAETCFKTTEGKATFLFSKAQGGLWPYLSEFRSYMRARKVSSNEVNVVALVAGKLAFVAKETPSEVDVLALPTNPVYDTALTKWVAGRKVIPPMSTSAKLTAFCDKLNETSSKEVVHESTTISYKKMPNELKQAITFFTDSKDFAKLKVCAPKVDACKTVASALALLKAEKLTASGYLYTYFPTFFLLCLMENKALALDLLAARIGLCKQLDAFSVAPASILAGGWARAQEPADLKRAYALVQKNMFRLIPLQKADLEKKGRQYAPGTREKLERIYKKYYEKHKV